MLSRYRRHPVRTAAEGAHAQGLAVAAMPSIDTLSVGGTLSVNAHGADFRVGSLVSSVRSLTLVTADGHVHHLSRTDEPELFAAVIGGYGLFGVIVDAELDLVPNRMYELRQTTISSKALPSYLEQDVFTDPTARLAYAHLSTAPNSLLARRSSTPTTTSRRTRKVSRCRGCVRSRTPASGGWCSTSPGTAEWRSEPSG